MGVALFSEGVYKPMGPQMDHGPVCTSHGVHSSQGIQLDILLSILDTNKEEDGGCDEISMEAYGF